MNPNVPYNTGALKNMVNKVKAYCAHIIPLVFDNTLSYYESLCACVAKINECCDAINAQNLTIVEFTHMVEVELDKFETYVQTTINEFGERLADVETAIGEMREAISTINDELTHKVDKRTDVTDTVTENNEQVITSGGIWRALRNDIPDATHNSKGVVQIGDGILVADGIISPRTATHDATGVVQIGDGILVADGIISPRQADRTRTGVVKIGDNINVENAVISVPDGDYNTKGVLSVGANLTVNDGEVDVPDATALQKGVMAVGTGLTANNGIVSVNSTNTIQQGSNLPITSGAVYTAFQNVGDNLPDASYVGKGVVMVDGVSPDHALTLTNGVLGINNASTALKGAVKIGDNINVSNDGIISVPEANAVTKGVVTIDALDSNLTLQNGVLDVPTGTKSNKGVLQVGTNLTVSNGVVDVARADDLGGEYGVVAPKVGGAITANNGEIDVKDATTTTKGAVRLTDTIQSGDTSHVPTSDAVYNAVTGLVPPQVADATKISKGIVQIGDNIDVSSGLISVPTASTLFKGVVQTGANITNNNGTISVATATASNLGVVKLGDNIDVDANGTISVADGTTLAKGVVQKTAYVRDNDMNVPTSKAVYDAITGMTIADATTTSKGIVQIGDNIDVSNGEISVPNATTTNKGVVTVDALTGNLTLNNGVLDVPTGNTTTKGVLQVGGNLTVSGGIVDVPTADSTTKGVVTVDALSGNLTLNNGVLDVPTGSTSQKGVLQVGSNLEVSNGVVNVPKATQSSRGVVVPALSGAITATNDGEIDVQTATTSAKGVVTLANSVTSGDTTHVPTADAVYNAIAGAGVADATTTSKGIIQVGSNLEVSSGVLSVPDATTSTKGVLKYGNNFNINGNGQLAVNTGANVTTDANGAITVPTADAINKGVVSIGSNIDINNGAISVPVATSSTLGVVKPSSYSPLYVDGSGNLDINSATASTSGVIKVGSNLDMTNGVLSVPDATTLVKGAVQKTAYVRDNDYDVPTSKAVYDAINSSGVTYLFPTPRESWTNTSDCFLASTNASSITANDVKDSSHIIIGTKSFTSSLNYAFIWIKKSLINSTSNNVIELLTNIKISLTMFTNQSFSTSNIPFINTYSNSTKLVTLNETEYLVISAPNNENALVTIEI